MTRDTVIEEVRPFIPTSPVKLDAWRWASVPSFEQYVARVLERERERAEKWRAG